MEAKTIKQEQKATENQTIQNSESNKQPNASAESINNATDNAGNTNETASKQEQKATEAGGKKVVVEYIGGSIWRDSNKELWSRQDNGAGIKSQRQYSAEEYEKRDDIKFMVGYGEMKATYVE